MPKLNKTNSFTTKIVFLFIALSLVLLSILFTQIIPKMQKEQREHTIQQVENMVSLTNHQLNFAVKILIENSQYSEAEFLRIMRDELKILRKLYKKENFHSKLNKTLEKLKCQAHIINKNKKTIFKTEENELTLKIKSSLIKKKWLKIKKENDYICPKASEDLYYMEEISKEDKIVLSCNPKRIYKKSVSYEAKVKEDIQKGFSLTKDLHKGKIYLMWLNSNNKDNNQIMYKHDDDYFNTKYCISKISNIIYPRTGLLSTKNIFDSIDKEPIIHMLDKPNDRGNYVYPTMTWVRSLNDIKNRKLLFITSVYVEDIENKIDSAFWKILPATLIALLVAVLLGYFLLKKLFNSINTLANTAKKVNDGNLSLRSGIKTDDDIGILAKTFDKMLDSIEINIKNLDKEVLNKTKELRSSLNERETLLKEIHHRVKNNLAMTISLIKLQKLKLSDKETKDALSDIQERVYTMELLHRKLYESKNLSHIDFAKYIQDLVKDLYATYKKDKNIQIHIDIVPFNMNIELALPCGLIINECLTNSFKHAFLEKDGNIFVSFYKEKDSYILSISDDGLGIPSKIEVKSAKSLGLRLIRSIAKDQLLGKLTYSNKNLSTFEIRFSILD